MSDSIEIKKHRVEADVTRFRHVSDRFAPAASVQLVVQYMHRACLELPYDSARCLTVDTPTECRSTWELKLLVIRHDDIYSWCI